MKFRASRIAVVALLFLAAACQPRQPVVVAPPPPPPPPAPVLTDVELEAQRGAEARRLWEQGIVLGRQGRWSDAANSYRRAAELRPDSAVYHMAQADALVQQGRAWEGADAMKAGIAAAERKQPVNHRVLAVDYDRLIALLDRLGRADEARLARDRQRFHRMMRDSAPPR
jgi:tetratricopeptide (TPR) repeat protein